MASKIWMHLHKYLKWMEKYNDVYVDTTIYKWFAYSKSQISGHCEPMHFDVRFC